MKTLVVTALLAVLLGLLGLLGLAHAHAAPSPAIFGSYKRLQVTAFGGLDQARCEDPTSVYGFASAGATLEIGNYPEPEPNPCDPAPAPAPGDGHDHDHGHAHAHALPSHVASLQSLIRAASLAPAHDHDHHDDHDDHDDHNHEDELDLDDATARDPSILVQPTVCHAVAWSRSSGAGRGLGKRCGGADGDYEIVFRRSEDEHDHDDDHDDDHDHDHHDDDHEHHDGHFGVAADHPEGLLHINVTHRASGQGCTYTLQDTRFVEKLPDSFPLYGRWRPVTSGGQPEVLARGGIDASLCNDSSQVFGFFYGSSQTIGGHYHGSSIHYELSLDQCANADLNTSRHTEGLVWKACGPAEIRWQTQSPSNDTEEAHSHLLATVERLANRSEACEFQYERRPAPAPAPAPVDTTQWLGQYPSVPGSVVATGALSRSDCQDPAQPWGFAWLSTLSVGKQAEVIPSLCPGVAWSMVHIHPPSGGHEDVLRKDCGDVRIQLSLRAPVDDHDDHDHGDHGHFSALNDHEDHEDEHAGKAIVMTVSRLSQPADTCVMRFAEASASHDHDHDHEEAEQWEAYTYTLLATMAGAAVSLAGGLLLAFGVRRLLDWVDDLLALSAGTLLGSACFTLLPEIGHTVGLDAMAGFVVILGILFGLLAEKLVHVHVHTGFHSGHGASGRAAVEANHGVDECRVCIELCPHECLDEAQEPNGDAGDHGDNHGSHGNDAGEVNEVVPPVPMAMKPLKGVEEHAHAPEHRHQRMHLAISNLIGDLIHNFIDGALIGAAFVQNSSVGITVTLAILLHELPQEMGDFGVLIHAGFSRGQALMLNFAVSLAAVIGGMIAVAIGRETTEIHYLIPFNVGLFVYLALCGILPDLMARHIKDSEDSHGDSSSDPGTADDKALAQAGSAYGATEHADAHDDDHGHNHSHRGWLNAKQRRALRIVFFVLLGLGMMALLLLLPEEAHSHEH